MLCFYNRLSLGCYEKASQFVLDTPKMLLRLVTQGSRQMADSESAPRELHPNCRSDRAALIACGGLNTARTVTRREYHCPLCGLWRNRELPDILSRYFPLTTFHRYCFLAGCGVPLHTLMLITITKRMYLANDYSVVKVRSCFCQTKEKQVKGVQFPFTCFHTQKLKVAPKS